MTSRPVVVSISPKAIRQIREIDRWWRAHRTFSPDLFWLELETAIRVLELAPLAGRRIPPGRRVRRLLLPGSRYHVYYEFHPRLEEVEILTIWSAVRRAPRLKKASSGP